MFGIKSGGKLGSQVDFESLIYQTPSTIEGSFFTSDREEWTQTGKFLKHCNMEPLSAAFSLKLRRLSFFSTLTVVWVHAFNLSDRYLWPGYKLNIDWNANAFFQLWVANGLFRFAIPLFFLISGFLAARREGILPYPEMVKKRAKYLLVPFVAWSAFGLLVTFLFEQFPLGFQWVRIASLSPYGDTPLQNYSWDKLLETWFLRPISFQLWFLRALFIYALLYPVISRVVVRFPKVSLPVFGLFWLGSVGLFIVEGEGLFFFSLGIWLAKNKNPWQFSPGLKQYFYLATLAFIISLGKTQLAFMEGDYTFPLAYFSHKILQVLLVFVVWFGYDVLPKISPGFWFDKLSSTNFFIYGAHVPLVYFLTDGLFHYFGHSPNVHWLVFIFLPLLLIAFWGFLGLILKRFSPVIFGIWSGFRKYPY